MYKENLALNNLQWLICHKPNQTKTKQKTFLVLRQGPGIWVIYLYHKVPMFLYISFRRTASDLCMHYLFVWSYFSLLHNSEWITYPHQVVPVLCLCFAAFTYCLIYYLLRTKKINKQNWKETDSWVYDKTIKFIHHRQRHESNNQEQYCFSFMGTSQMSFYHIRVTKISLSVLPVPTNPRMQYSRKATPFLSLRENNFDIFHSVWSLTLFHQHHYIADTGYSPELKQFLLRYN